MPSRNVTADYVNGRSDGYRRIRSGRLFLRDFVVSDIEPVTRNGSELRRRDIDNLSSSSGSVRSEIRRTITECGTDFGKVSVARGSSAIRPGKTVYRLGSGTSFW